jgi:hypothetical protein
MFGFRRLTAFLGVVGLAMVFALDGYSFGVSYPGGAHVTMHPLLLAAWPLVFVSVLVSLTADAQTGGHPAHWSRRITACVIDGGTFAHCLFVPYALLVLVCEVGGMPPPWESARSESSLIDSVYILLFLPLFFALWAGLGLALHPARSCATSPLEPQSPNRLSGWQPKAFLPISVYLFSPHLMTEYWRRRQFEKGKQTRDPRLREFPRDHISP